MKRVFSWFLVMALMLSMFAVPAYATGSEDIKADIVLTEGTHNGRNGLFVEFGIQTGTTGISAIAYAIAYDPAILELVDASGAPVTVPTSDYSLVKESMIEHNLAGFDAAFSNVYLLGIGSAVGMVFFRGSMTDMPFATWTLLDKCFLAYREGKDVSDITKDAVRMATVAEADKLGQSSVVFATCGADNYGIGFCDGTPDTAGWAANLSFGKDFTFAKPALPSSASVSISGTSKIGETLTATISDFPSDAGTLTYKWYRGDDTTPISGADTDTYTPSTKDDVGETIKVVVTAANYSGNATATTTDTVEKADGPAAPTTLAVVSVTDTTITVTEDAAWEYSMDDGRTWQDSNVFKNLAPHNYYSQIVARVRETDTHKASEKSGAISATTAMGSANADTITKLKATHTPYNDTYDGTAHDALSVDADALSALTGWSAAYSTDGNSYGSTMPTVTNVADSGKIYVKFTNTSYADVIAEYDVTVSQKDISGATITYGTQNTYNGSEQDVVVASVVLDGTTLTVGSNYALDGNTGKATNVEGKKLEIFGKGNYSGSATAATEWKLQQATPVVGDFVTSGLAASYSYTGSEQDAPVPTTAKNGMGTITVNYPDSTTPKYVGDYDLTFSVAEGQNYKEAGPFTYGTMKIVAADQTPTFKTPVSLVTGGHRLDLRTLVSGAKGDVSFTIDGVNSTHAVLEDGHTLTSTVYPGTVNINVSITTKDENNDGTSEYKAFSKDEVITVNVIDKTTDTKTMKVSQDDITYGATVSPSTNKPDGTDEVSYTYEGRNGTTYNSATAPTNVGKYTVKAKCESSTTIYTAEDDFEILPKSISGMAVTLDKTSLEYNGSAQTVNVTGVGTLTNSDYTVTSGNSGTDVGSYTVTVTGKGNYDGIATATWKITQATPSYTVPTGLTAKYGQTLADVNIGATTGWSWMDSTQSVGDASTTAKIFKAKFTPTDPTNYKTVENIDVSVTVDKADMPTSLADIPVSQKYNVTTEQSKDIDTTGMPDDAGTLTYVKGTASTNGSVKVDSWSVDATTGKVTYKLSNGAAGDTVTLPVVITSTNYADATVNVVITLTKPSYSGGGGSYNPTYDVVVDKTKNGDITASPKAAAKGTIVTLTIDPDKGYELDALEVLDKNGDRVKLTEKNGKYTFIMPASKVTVKGSFAAEAPEQIFFDVPVNAYYYDAVKWAADKGITGGVSPTLFAPDQSCTRAQIVTFLWRAAGSPAPKSMSTFVDVSADAYYAKAVAWAVENGITGGTGNGKFSPDATCTRAQAVTFLYRANGAPAVVGSAVFSDVAANAYYANAVVWAEKNGVTGGIGGGLFGSDNNCTRAQIVTFLYRSVK